MIGSYVPSTESLPGKEVLLTGGPTGNDELFTGGLPGMELLLNGGKAD